jgi:hypothetical protein
MNFARATRNLLEDEVDEQRLVEMIVIDAERVDMVTGTLSVMKCEDLLSRAIESCHSSGAKLRCCSTVWYIASGGRVCNIRMNEQQR